jgi:hypothetical protein
MPIPNTLDTVIIGSGESLPMIRYPDRRYGPSSSPDQVLETARYPSSRLQPWRIMTGFMTLFFMMMAAGSSSYYHLPISYLQISRYFPHLMQKR